MKILREQWDDYQTNGPSHTSTHTSRHKKGNADIININMTNPYGKTTPKNFCFILRLISSIAWRCRGRNRWFTDNILKKTNSRYDRYNKRFASFYNIHGNLCLQVIYHWKAYQNILDYHPTPIEKHHLFRRHQCPFIHDLIKKQMYKCSIRNKTVIWRTSPHLISTTISAQPQW